MKKQSTGRGFAYLSMAELLVKIMSVVYMPLLYRIIGQVGHGIYAVAYDAFTLIYVLTNEGIQRGVAKLVAELYAEDNPRDALKAFRLSRTILILGGLFASLLLYFMAPFIAENAESPQAALSIQALAPTVLITAVLSAYRGYFLGRSFITANALSKIVEQVVNVAVSLLGAFLLMKAGTAMGVAGGTLGTSVGALVSVLLLIHEFRKGKFHRVRKSEQSPEAYHHTSNELLRKLWTYAFPITLTAGLMHIGGFIDMFIVKKRLVVAGFFGDALDAVFSDLVVFKSLLVVPNTIIVSLAAVLLPGIASANALKNQDDIDRKVSFATKMVLMISIPAFVGMTVLAEPIFAFLYPESGGVHLLKYGSITVIFLGFIQIQNSLYQGIGKFYWGTIAMSFGIGARILINYLLVGIPEINVFGGIFSHFANFFIPFAINHYLLTRVLGFQMPILKNGWRPALSSLAMGVVLYFMTLMFKLVHLPFAHSALSTLIMVLAGIAVYGVAMILIGGITKKDVTDISPRLYRIIPSGLRRRMRP
jgi:stage V sporulation protein B